LDKSFVKRTEDGSPTLYSEKFGASYHSIHGAVQESMHVYIEAGLNKAFESFEEVGILEVGIGSGLNALLTKYTAEKNQRHVHYTGIEPFPISINTALEFLSLNELELPFSNEEFISFHTNLPDSPGQLGDYFHYQKVISPLENCGLPPSAFQLVYYDAFAPSSQPELWTEEIFEPIYTSLEDGGILVTYCAKGDVKRALKNVGFELETLAGPPGKREMIRCTK
jgi:tRNA U34 5-methylaminomethyl-2-thiouridine-forming methyltransferase MnmC